MIVRDERANLERIVPQLLDVVDEIVIIDTGSCPEDREWLDSLDSRVVVADMPWGDDFSAPRNLSISLASSSYILVIDPDFRLTSEMAQYIGYFRRTLDPDLASCYYVNLLNTHCGTTTIENGIRIFPNLPGVTFKGRVHESVEESIEALNLKKVDSGITFSHLSPSEPEELTAKLKYYRKLLELDLADDRGSARTNGYLCLTCEMLGDFRAALTYGHEAFWCDKTGCWSKRTMMAVCGLYMRQGRGDEAVSWAYEMAAQYPDDGMVWYTLGQVCAMAGAWKLASEAYTKALNLKFQTDYLSRSVNFNEEYTYNALVALKKAGKQAAYNKIVKDLMGCVRRYASA